jgi:hypothetical protein
MSTFTSIRSILPMSAMWWTLEKERDFEPGPEEGEARLTVFGSVIGNILDFIPVPAPGSSFRS